MADLALAISLQDLIAGLEAWWKGQGFPYTYARREDALPLPVERVIVAHTQGELAVLVYCHGRPLSSAQFYWRGGRGDVQKNAIAQLAGLMLVEIAPII